MFTKSRWIASSPNQKRAGVFLLPLELGEKMIGNGTMTTSEVLSIGSRVHCILYGGRDGVIFNIRGEQRPETCQSNSIILSGGKAEFDIVWENGTESLRTPEALVRGGVQWRVLDGIATADEIAAMRGYTA
jgi:hypothetical protein